MEVLHLRLAEAGMQRTVVTLLQRRPIVTYFVLAYAFSWVLYPLIAFNPLYGVPGLFAPALAAVIASALEGGRGEVRRLFARVTHWRVGLPWYTLALGLPLLLSLVILGIAILRGAPASFQLVPISALGAIIFVLVIGEEIGWRGYAQPALERARSPLAAALILGVLWGLWHLPTFVLPGLPQEGVPLPAFIVFTTTASVVLAWLMKHSHGSVIIATLFHGSFNTLGFLTPSLTLAGRWWLTAIVYVLAAAVLVVLDRQLVERPARSASPVPAATD